MDPKEEKNLEIVIQIVVLSASSTCISPFFTDRHRKMVVMSARQKHLTIMCIAV